MNTTFLESPDERSLIPAMPRGRVLRSWLTEAKYEAVRVLRLPGFAGPFLILPVALYLFFGVVLYGGVNDRAAVVSIFTAFAVFGVMRPAMFGFGLFIASERERGLLALRRALPAPPAGYLFAKMVMAMLFGAMNLTSITAAALIFGHLRFTAPQLWSFAAVMVPGSLPFCALGFLIGSHASAKAAPVLAARRLARVA